ncbi:MAG: alpha/beta fold hydrolase [Gammaproteobacteria bacterium]
MLKTDRSRSPRSRVTRKKSGGLSVFAVVILALSLGACSPPQAKRPVAHGLEKTPCWFEDPENLPPHTCYFMNVEETHGHDTGRTVAFPIILFKSTSTVKLSPVLHLGGGGPGASLALDQEYNVWSIYQQMRSLSLEQGRDLYLMDPRGAGQAQPLLMCQEFVDNVIPRWQKNMSLRESYDSGHADFEVCVTDLKQTGLNFSAFSSETVVADLEKLRAARGVDQWVLYGASYASIYAQLYAQYHPERIESMILDSATFLDMPRHEVLVREITEPYRKLFDHCTVTQNCTNLPVQLQDRTEQRFWSLISKLDAHPVPVTVLHPDSLEELTVVLTGWRFLDSMLWGVYEETIFTDFPNILTELENGQGRTVRPYVEDILDYLLDESFGDISAASHYCIDRKPYIDEAKVREKIDTIPYEYTKNIARLGLEYLDYCEEMNIRTQGGKLDQPIITDVPTLFVHGRLDSVTLLDHVTERLNYFSNGHIVTSSQAHIVLDDPCVLATAKQFLISVPTTTTATTATTAKHCTQ